MKMKILIGDDHPIVQAALGAALAQMIKGLQVLAAASLDEVEARLMSHADSIDLVLLDLDMPGNVGFTGLFLLQSQFPTVPVAILSAEQDPVTVRRAIAFGASGYIPKALELATMTRAILEILEGGVWVPFPLDDLSAASGDDVAAKRFASLTPQQLRILTGVVQGKLNKQIAGELNIAEQTVKSHVSVILKKLGVTTRTQAAIAAERLTRKEHDLKRAAF